MKHPQPFFRKSKQCWYVQIGSRQRSLGKDKKKAWEKFYQIMASNEVIEESTATVAQLFELYLEWVQKNRAPGTYDKIKRHLSSFASFIGLRTKVATLSGADLSEWVENEKTWNSTSRNEAITSVVRCFNWAVGKKHLKVNNVAHVPDKPRRRRREIVFSQEDWTKLRSFVRDRAFADFLDFMWETGCRPIEARTMETKHVNLDGGVVIFPPSEAKGERHERVIFLTDKAIEICQRNMKDEGPILRNTRGRAWTKATIHSRFFRLKKKLGKPACAYAIRHTFATEGLLSGMDSLTLSQLMGHCDVSTLARNYAHLARNPTYLKEQARKLRQV